MRPAMLRQLTREPALAAGITFAVVPPALMHFFSHEKVMWSGMAHALFVSLSAGAATIAAVWLTVAAARRGDGRSVMIGTAFAAMAALLTLHGLSTPGVIFSGYGVVAFSGAATIPVGGALLALCTLPILRRPGAVRPLLALQALLLAVVAGLGIVGLAFPKLVPAVPEPRSAPAWIALGVGLAFYGIVGWRAFRTYRLTRRPADLLVVVGTTWLAAALAASLLLTYMDLGWWIGHGLEVVGIAAIGLPVVLDLRRGTAQSRPLLGDLSPCQLVAAEEAFLGGQVGALTQLLAERDTYTEEHTRRVALRAVQVGVELGLAPERLRVLAAGGLLHDMGKLSVPDEILKKPGSLTEEEYDVIKKHSEWGEELLAKLGFPGDVRRLVRDHHERLDGRATPSAYGDQLDIETRILCTCDVYDALISPRVNRGAWPYERAIGLLWDEAGKQFDERCASALERVLERENVPALAIAV
jgi:putative nucleotidyltransferase with HDIG domain